MNVKHLSPIHHNTIEFTCGETIAEKEVVRLDGTGKLVKARADTLDNSRHIGIALSNGVLDDVIRVAIDGGVVNYVGLTPNTTYVVSKNTAGAIRYIHDAEFTTGDVLMRIGRAISSSVLLIDNRNSFDTKA